MKGFFYRILGIFIWLIFIGIISSIGDLFSDNKSSVNTTELSLIQLNGMIIKTIIIVQI